MRRVLCSFLSAQKGGKNINKIEKNSRQITPRSLEQAPNLCCLDPSLRIGMTLLRIPVVMPAIP